MATRFGQIFDGYLARAPSRPGGSILYTLLNRLQRSAGKNLTLRNVSGRHIFDNVFRFEDTVASTVISATEGRSKTVITRILPSRATSISSKYSR